MGKLYTPQEYAYMRRCSQKTLERERTSGTGCPYVLIGRRVYYREEDIETFLAGRVRLSTSEAPILSKVMRAERRSEPKQEKTAKQQLGAHSSDPMRSTSPPRDELSGASSTLSEDRNDALR